MLNGNEAGLLLVIMPIGAVLLVFMDKILGAVCDTIKEHFGVE
jgi:hypothetical protein